MMEVLHVIVISRISTREIHLLATALRVVRGVQTSGPWFWLAGTTTRKTSTAGCLVLFHSVPDLLLGTNPEVPRHG
jgi:hypothetical protein